LEQVEMLSFALENLEVIAKSTNFPVKIDVPCELTSYFECVNFFLSKEKIFDYSAG
jgi:hypothetical protein